jgi:hypothetical protein
MTLTLAVLLLLAAAPPPADGLGRTPPQGWARTGYQQLRWGMGPGDVKDALAAGGKVLQTAEPFELGAGYDPHGEGGARVAAPGLVVAGHPSVLGFRFFRGRLAAVALLPADDPGDPAAWDATLTELLVERYGPPSATVDGQRLWQKDGLRVTLPFLPGWTSSVGWFAPRIPEAGPGAEAGQPAAAPATLTPEEAADLKARQEAARKAEAAARKAEEAARKARAEAEKAAQAARKAEAAKL